MISPKLLTAGQILQVVRGMQNSKGSVMNALYKIADGHAEAMELWPMQPPETGTPPCESCA